MLVVIVGLTTTIDNRDVSDQCLDGGMRRLADGLIQDEGFSDVFDLWNRAAEVEGFGKDNLEDLVVC